VLYARATRLPEELTGTMRLAEKKVKVNVIGTDQIGEFTTVDPGGYVLIHEQDLAKLIETIKELRE
jgi:hypothetical protein